MDLLKKMEQLRKAGDIAKRQRVAHERQRQDRERQREAEAQRKAEERRKVNEEASRKALERERAAAERRAERVEKSASRVEWGQVKIERVPVYVRDKHPYAGARQICFTVGFRDGHLRLDAQAVPWIKEHVSSATVHLRVVHRTGALFEQDVPKDKIPAIFAEYTGKAA